MTTYLLGILTVLAVVYLAAGVYIAYYNLRHSRPSQWEHNGPPLTDTWAMKPWVFVLTLILTPLLFPVVIVVLRSNDRYCTAKWNRSAPENRQKRYDQWRAARK